MFGLITYYNYIYTTFYNVKVFEMVRKLGIRHVVVVNMHNEVVGMITTKNLVALEQENHMCHKPSLKQKPIFFKATMNRDQPNGVQRYWNKLKDSVIMDPAGRVCLANGRYHRRGQSLTSKLRQNFPGRTGSIDRENDVPYIHVPYETI